MKKIWGKYPFFKRIAAVALALSAVFALNAQKTDSLAVSDFSKSNSGKVVADSLPPIRLDSVPGRAASSTSILPSGGEEILVVDLSKVKTSPDALDAQVDYGSRDSMWFDVENKQVHLYGSAFMKYTSIDLKAGYILLDYNLNTVTAEGLADSSGRVSEPPEFKDGEQSFSAKKLKYNFKSKKGIIYEAYTKQEDLFVLGQKAKFVGVADAADSSKTRNTVYNKNAILTTCDDPHPHFGIRTRKLKVIPDKLVVTGFSNLEIGGVPTPLVLPFGFYPITKDKKSGLIIPRDFDFSDQWGLGLKNIGYYIPINRGMDLTLRGDIYFQGSHSLGADLRYTKRYKFNGNAAVTYNNRLTEDATARKVSQKSFGIRWSHNQDSKAHPTRNFGGSVNIQTNRDQARNQNDFRSVYQNSLSSNLTYRQSFPGKPFQLSASMSHSQNTQTRQMTINLPNVNFTMQQIYPLKRKNRTGTEKWFEKISLNYSSQLQNTINATDTTLFTRETLNKSRMGIQHRANSSLPLKIFKYITLSPAVSFEENWYPYTVKHDLLTRVDTVFKYDTVQGEVMKSINIEKTKWGKDTTLRDWGFAAFRNWNASISANTALFKTVQFRKGWLRGIRHTIKPTVSFGFGPDFTKDKYNYFREYYTSLLPQLSDTLRYGIFDDAIFGRPSFSPQQLAISYGFTNLLEMKYFSRRDSAARKVRIFDNLAFRGTYVLTADSLKWTTIGTGGVFRFFKGISNLNWNASFDPYILDEKGRRVNRFVVKEQGKLVRLDRLGFVINTQLPLSKIRDWTTKKEATPPPPGTPAPATGQPAAPTNPPPVSSPKINDDLLSWLETFRMDHTIGFERRNVSGSNRDTVVITRNSLGVSGSIQLNSKWRFDIGNISYDLISKSLVYPDLSISRDLHCWEMSFSWQPERGTYNFFINVRPGTLDFLRVPYRKNNEDGRFSF